MERSILSPEVLGITAEGLKGQIRRIEQIAVYDDWLHVYLLEMRSMRVAHRRPLNVPPPRSPAHRSTRWMIASPSLVL